MGSNLVNTRKAVKTLTTYLKLTILIDCDVLVYGKNRSAYELRKWRLYQRCYLIVTFLHTSWFGACGIITDEETLNLLADYIRFFGLGDKRWYINFVAVVVASVGWTMAAFSMYLESTKSGQKLLHRVTFPLRVLNGDLKFADIGISRVELDQYRRHFCLTMKLLNTGLRTIVIAFMLYLPLIYYVYLDIRSYWLSALLIGPNALIWFTGLMTSLGSIVTLFYMTNNLLGMKIRRHLMCINEPVLHVMMVNVKHVQIIHELNRFWRLFLLMAHIVFIPCISIMFYSGFISPLADPFIRFIIIVVTVEFISLLTFVCLSASNIHKLVSIVIFFVLI